MLSRPGCLSLDCTLLLSAQNRSQLKPGSILTRHAEILGEFTQYLSFPFHKMTTIGWYLTMCYIKGRPKHTVNVAICSAFTESHYP